MINEAVCEGCGDCSVQSSCLSVVPVDTDFGTKRQIDQSACNQDFPASRASAPASSPSTAASRARAAPQPTTPTGRSCPRRKLPTATQPYNLIITGVGGTGRITLSALVGMAAHLDGKGISTLDMTGLAQNITVAVYLRMSPTGRDIHAARIATGRSGCAVIGGDLVVTTQVLKPCRRFLPGRPGRQWSTSPRRPP